LARRESSVGCPCKGHRALPPTPPHSLRNKRCSGEEEEPAGRKHHLLVYTGANNRLARWSVGCKCIRACVQTFCVCGSFWLEVVVRFELAPSTRVVVCLLGRHSLLPHALTDRQRGMAQYPTIVAAITIETPIAVLFTLHPRPFLLSFLLSCGNCAAQGKYTRTGFAGRTVRGEGGLGGRLLPPLSLQIVGSAKVMSGHVCPLPKHNTATSASRAFTAGLSGAARGVDVRAVCDKMYGYPGRLGKGSCQTFPDCA